MNEPQDNEVSHPMRKNVNSRVGFVLVLAALAVVAAVVLDMSYLPHIAIATILLLYMVIESADYTPMDSPDAFFLYRRRMPRSEFVWTYVATNIGLFSSVAYSAILSYYYGIAGMLWTTAAWFGGMYWFSRTIPQFLPFFRNGHTLHEFISVRYGKSDNQKLYLRVTTSILTAALYFASIGVEVKFASDVFRPSLGLTSSMAVALCLAAVGIFYTFLSGFRGVVHTDKLQYGVMGIGTVGILGIVGVILTRTGFDLDPSFFSLRSVLLGPDPFFLASNAVLLAVYQFCVMDMWQRCIGVAQTDLGLGRDATDKEMIVEMRRLTFRKAILPFAWLFIVWFAIGLAALGGKWTQDPNAILPAFIAQAKAIQPWGYALEALILLVFVSAAISTFDAFLIALTQTFMYDIYGTIVIRGLSVRLPDVSASGQAQFVNIGRIFVAIFGLAAVGIAFLSFGVMSFWVSMYSIMLSMFPPVFAQTLMLKNVSGGGVGPPTISPGYVMFGICAGAISAIGLGVYGTFISPNPVYSSWAPITAIAISSISLLAGVRK